jgi:hypothetical protein
MPKTKTSKSNKKTKDPKASKRHRTAYILFSIEKCDQVKVIIFYLNIFIKSNIYFRVKI